MKDIVANYSYVQNRGIPKSQQNESRSVTDLQFNNQPKDMRVDAK